MDRAWSRLAGYGVVLVSIGAVADGCRPAQRMSVAEGGSATASGARGEGSGGAPSRGTGGDGGGGWLNLDFADAGAMDDGIADPCGSRCGPTELCDPAHLGSDDNCNGQVDEGCACSPGAVHWCFAGDPSYRHAPGCFDGTETCSELGTWGPCLGGVQAVPPDNCFLDDTSACHAITALPYATVGLELGTGAFRANAVPGSEAYAVKCPAGVSQCPAVTPPSSFEALQSGEYTVTYTKRVAGDANPVSCTFALFVGGPGLRIELSWEHPAATEVGGADLDLHVHQPLSTEPWSVAGAPEDCTWSSCKFDQLDPAKLSPVAPRWFPPANVAPDPANWDLQPIGLDAGADAGDPADYNTCYNDLHGVGAEWAALGMGCHNPRLDIDLITCLPSITDPADPAFCAPENVNIDYPPSGQWIRVAVNYYYNHGVTYAVHPEIKIFCDGALSADLGPHSYSLPEQAVTFEPSDGAGIGGAGNLFWIAADVAFTTDRCGVTTCVVQPLYADPTTLTPLLTLDTQATAAFFPPWPAPAGADAGP
jgi:hypothetical protein